ncbi:bifunctional 2-polyprenyl-6-hydroxyphenol methylase/3-demethylubiquinol 3-O-methyltransferase UbiG [Jiella sp. MQZ9-1]|uniref:Ubiquinone biosynthesis O-methyltransferase n=1 Tax=Jiella flava TaxID=2816857 RepID=A0A939FW62_9HYPH|nr:bifunctional 2-polyprenyl-6-hydroxyphenol methylase/3-demethylubiquinol 3-O-methyltransferase UbiG [Jiella flava]MBO0661974.1 bifunctional 2-polyprenyl-6-hydroxyphenol methylase/3-demethylubiquinol 3-O-methyltransferase UbiG [Jiella flava]MCD2470699.1 bifunctional 2-polyprenyl-6-hydroxyphenol methylase/3-demethylubiquinol 3-O-methyltransferase UbiG [Jiella flava]
MTTSDGSTIDAGEIERFSRLAQEWWNPAGKFKPLHKFNPVRLDYIRQELAANFSRDLMQPKPLAGLSVLDIGCGGGLIAEPLSRLGATVVGADASDTNIEVAKLHAAGSGLDIDYRATTAEAIAAGGETFDAVLALEIVEHVADVDLFLSSCAAMVKPGGLLFVATINRTVKALTFAIVGAEYVLGWLPKGTHQYSKLVRPQEIAAPVTAAGLSMIDEQGVVYHPLADEWRLSRDTDVNYMILARRSEL